MFLALSPWAGSDPEALATLLMGEAVRSGRFVVAPYVSAAFRGGQQDFAAYASDVDSQTAPWAGVGLRVVVRPDRPLVRPFDLSGLNPRAWPLLRFIADRAVEDGSGRGPYLVAHQNDEDRELLRAQRALLTREPAGDDLRVEFVWAPQLVLLEPDGRQHIFRLPKKNLRFDPSTYAAGFLPREETVLPREFRRAFDGRSVSSPSRAATLEEWVRSLSRAAPEAVLSVDARARGWISAVGAPGDTAGVAFLAEALARSQGLYWRSLGSNRWTLSATPDGIVPEEFAYARGRQLALAQFYRVLSPLARSGILPEDAMALMARGGRARVAELSADEVRRVQNLIKAGSLLLREGEKDRSAFEKLTNDPNRLSACTVSVIMPISFAFKSRTSDYGSGITLP